MLKITLVRHGESVDNLKPIWAGTLDSPLSNHGMNQSILFGWDQRDVIIDAIYASDLTRAYWTAQSLHFHNRNPEVEDACIGIEDSNEASGPPSERTTESKTHKPIKSELLREQHFGDAEGQKWAEGEYSGFAAPWLKDRDFKFGNGESLNDVAARAKRFVDAVIRPWLFLATEKDLHVAIVAHGISIKQLLSTLCELDPLNHVVQPEAMGLGNCAYHRIELTPLPSIKPSRELLEKARKAVAPSDTAPTEPFALDEDLRIEPVELKLVAQADHLDGLVRNRTDPRTDSEAFIKMYSDIQAGNIGTGGVQDTPKGTVEV